MLSNIVSILKIMNIDDFATIFVKFSESFHDESLSLLAHGASYSSDKLFKGNDSIIVDIELFEKDINTCLVKIKSEIQDAFLKFILWECLRIIIVHDLELSHKSDVSSCTPGIKFISELLEYLIGIKVFLSVFDSIFFQFV